MMSLQAQTGKFEERERQRLTQNVVSTDDVRGDVNKKDVVIFDNGGAVRKQTTLLVHWLAHIFISLFPPTHITKKKDGGIFSTYCRKQEKTTIALTSGFVLKLPDKLTSI